MAATLLPEYPRRTSRQKLSATACPYLPRFGIEAHAAPMNMAGWHMPFLPSAQDRGCFDAAGPPACLMKEESEPMKAPSEVDAEHLAKALVSVLLEQGLSPDSLVKLGSTTSTKASSGLLPPGLALQLAVAGMSLDGSTAEPEETCMKPPPGLGLEDTMSVATSSTSELMSRQMSTSEDSDDYLLNGQQVPWQVSRQLREHDPECILEIRPVSLLRDDCVELLWEHFSNYFKVISILVASVVGSVDAIGTDTDYIAYLVGDDATSLQRMLEQGKEHIVAGHQVHLQGYGTGGFEQLPEVVEEAIRDCGLKGPAVATDSEAWESSSSGCA